MNWWLKLVNICCFEAMDVKIMFDLWINLENGLFLFFVSKDVAIIFGSILAS